MKSGCDSNEARCSSNEGGCGPVAMITLANMSRNDRAMNKLVLVVRECESLSLTGTDFRWQEPENGQGRAKAKLMIICDPPDRAHGPSFQFPF
jgi:hypothetical protein